MAAGKIFAISFAVNAVMGGTFAATMGQSAAAIGRLQDKTRELKAEQKRLDSAWQQSQAAARQYAQTVTRLHAQMQAGNLSESQYHAAVAAAAQKMNAASMSASTYRESLRQLRQETEATRASMAKMQAAQAARAAAGTRLSNAWSNVTGAAATAGMMAAPFIGAIETAANFEAAMSKVQAITRASGDDMQKLTADARMLGETTQFSATQAAEAMSYLGMAGWNSEQIIAGMPGLLSLAAAGGTDLARTADIVSDDLTAFGMSADQAGHMADVFAVTVTRTNTNVEMLGETMKYAAPVAHAFGASMEETAALAGLMANSGIKASQAGTALRAGFLRLAGPPKMAQKAMAELGLSMSDVTAQQNEARAAMEALGISMSDTNGPRKMSAILSELHDKLQGLSKEEKLAELKAIFGTEAATGWLAVLDAGPETFDKLVTEMENCDGEADKMAKTMMNNAKGAMIQLKSALESVAISAGSIFLPAITSITKAAADFAGGLSGWITNHQAVAGGLMAIAMAAATALPAVMALKVVMAGWSYMAAAVVEYRLAIQGSEAAMRTMAVATAAQGRAMAILKAATDVGMYKRIGAEAAATYTQLRAITWAQIGTSMKEGIVGGAKASAKALESLRTAAAASASSAKTNIVATLTGLPGRAARAGQAVAGMARSFSIADTLASAAQGVRLFGTALLSVGRASLAAAFSPLGVAIMAIAAAAYLVYANWSAVGPVFASLWGQITAAFSAAWMAIQPALENLQASFANLQAALGILWETLAPQLEMLGASVMMAVSQIAAAFAPLIPIITPIAEIVGGLLIGAFIAFAELAVGAITTAVSVIASVIVGIIDVIAGVVDMVAGILSGNWSAAWDGATSAVSAAMSAIWGIVSSIGSGIISTINNIVSSIRSAASSLSSLSFSGGGGGGEDVDVESNAKGGIYRKGAFLTTFAEDGPEAAIPLTRTSRALGLWRAAGRILGVGSAEDNIQTPQRAPGIRETVKEIREAPQVVQEGDSIHVAYQNDKPQRTARTTTEPATQIYYQNTVHERGPGAAERKGTMIAMPPINMTLNFYGEQEPKEVKAAVVEAGRKMQKSFAEQMEAWKRERGRLAYE